MKPNDMRERVKARERAASVHDAKLEAFLRSGEPVDAPTPHLVPDEADRTVTLREYRRFARLAAGERGPKREAWLDRALVELARLVYIERVLALDPLQRAALTPAHLTMLSVVDRDEIRRRFEALQEGSER